MQRVLRPAGWLYLLVIRDNEPDWVVQRAKSIGFAKVELLAFRKKFNEEIFILKLEKP